jgi:hypothetical protein
MQMKGMVNVNDDAGLENEADVMGAKAVQMAPKENDKIRIQRKEIANSGVAQLGIMDWIKNKFSSRSNKIAPEATSPSMQNEIELVPLNLAPQHEAPQNEYALPETFENSKIGDFKEGMEKIGKNWNTVKEHFKKAKKEGEPSPKIFMNSETADKQMTSLLKYRRFITVDKGNPNSAMSKAKKQLIGEDPIKEGEKENDYLDWDAAGSDEFTSDIDLNIMGRKSEFASNYAFEFFRKEWTKESGEVFDVNFYARDWKPNNLKDGLTAANSKIEDGKSVGKDKLLGTEFEGKGDANEAKRLEKINSIAKLIRDMHGLPPEILVSVQVALGGADKGAAIAAWQGGVQQLHDWEKAVEHNGSPSDSRAKRENLAYAAATSELAECRAKLAGAKNDDEKKVLEGKLLAARLKAAFYGPEAYVTEAAFIHGVINKQIQTTTFKKKEDKLHKVNIALDNDELLQVVIQNVGFAFHHAGELSSTDAEVKEMGYIAVAKYIYRACNAIKHMKVEEFAKLSTLAKNTVLKKKGIEARTKTIGKETVEGTLNGIDGLGAEVIKVNLINLLAAANKANSKNTKEEHSPAI